MVCVLMNHGTAPGESWYCFRWNMVLVNHGIA